MSPPAEKTVSAKVRENNYHVQHSLHQVAQLSETDFHRFSPLLTGAERNAIDRERSGEDNAGQVWDETVDARTKYAKYASAKGATGECVRVNVEEKRQALDRRLRRRFKKLLAKHELAPPIQAFERWVFNARSNATHKQRKDPLLPMNVTSEDGLVADLVRAGLAEKAAKQLVKELGKESTACVQELLDLDAKEAKDTSPQEVVISTHTNSIDVTCGKSFCKLSPAHFAKLKTLYMRHSGRSDETDFPRALMTLLLRYQSLLGHGFQAALPNVAFAILHRELGVDMECFASPLNARWGAHCSAFPDTDAPFGSLGDFFAFKPHEGSFEVNPPFVRPIMEKSALHVVTLLERAEGCAKALSFVVILPAWEECACWDLLKGSRWLQGMTLLPGGKHGFLDGAQHQRMDKYRPSPYPTAI
ncbi:phosphorylated CTD interacting factor 1 WW domain-containing protein, partial [Chytriomyces sp. MP71]